MTEMGASSPMSVVEGHRSDPESGHAFTLEEAATRDRLGLSARRILVRRRGYRTITDALCTVR